MLVSIFLASEVFVSNKSLDAKIYAFLKAKVIAR
jgi:hypothetical protein